MKKDKVAERDFYRDIDSYHALVVGRGNPGIHQLRTALKSLGIAKVSPSDSQSSALVPLSNHSISHVFFDLSEGDMPHVEFVKAALTLRPQVVIIALSENPGADNVFDLLKAGARGFIVPPPTLNSVESVTISATSGPPFSDAILRAKDRNQVFADLILDFFYRASVVKKRAREDERATPLFERTWAALTGLVDTAKMFCEHSEENLREKIIESCIRRADDEPKTRLSKLRSNLTKQRTGSDN